MRKRLNDHIMFYSCWNYTKSSISVSAAALTATTPHVLEPLFAQQLLEILTRMTVNFGT